MKIRLYLDEDTMDCDLVRALRIRGVDVTTALEQGMIGRDDIDHLEFANSQGRALYSFNVSDYQQLHSEYVTHSKLSFRNNSGATAKVSLRRTNAPFVEDCCSGFC